MSGGEPWSPINEEGQRYLAVFAGSEQVLCRSEAQAEHMRTLWAPAGYYERTDACAALRDLAAQEPTP